MLYHNPSVVYTTLVAKVQHFQAWAATYPVEQRSGEWECDYEQWPQLYDAFLAYVAIVPIDQ